MPKQSKLERVRDEVIQYYQEGHSLTEASQYFDIDQSNVQRFLAKHGIERRSMSEANSLKWTEERRKNHGELLKDKPSGATGKQWNFDRPIHKPSLCGENNPAWRGGILSLSRAIRDIPEYRLWREAIFRRDNYTCLRCGARSGKGEKIVLNADHIIPFVTLLRQFKITSAEDAIQCMALWDTENGRTLCESCHRQTDTYGLNLIHHLENQEEAS